MRYYIEAFRDGVKVLGNLDGQAALGELQCPLRAQRWRALGDNKRIDEYRLVDANGKIIAKRFTNHGCVAQAAAVLKRNPR